MLLLPFLVRSTRIDLTTWLVVGCCCCPTGIDSVCEDARRGGRARRLYYFEGGRCGTSADVGRVGGECCVCCCYVTHVEQIVPRVIASGYG
jgi:hypothetical protein